MGRKVDAMVEHVAFLARSHRIEVDVRPTLGAAWRSERRIEIPPIRRDTAYFVALHEIGHVVMRPCPRRRLEQEVAAWRWADEHALFTPTMTTCRWVADCLIAYRERALAWAGMVIPAGFDDEIAGWQQRARVLGRRA